VRVEDQKKLHTCYSPDRPANNSGFRYSPDDASVYRAYLQRTRPSPVSLIAINIQRVVYLPPPKQLFALGSRLDRLPDERSGFGFTIAKVRHSQGPNPNPNPNPKP